MADDLTPSDAIRLGRERVIGFAIESGGRTSHTTIIARSLNLPAVAGLSQATLRLIAIRPRSSSTARPGTVILYPDAEILEQVPRPAGGAARARPRSAGDPGARAPSSATASRSS